MDELLTPAQATRMLHVSKNTMYGLVRSGALHPVFKKGKLGSTRFHTEDVLALLKLREDRELDLPRVAAMSREAVSLARQTSARLDRLLNLLGVDIPRLSAERTDVLSLYIRVGDLLSDLEDGDYPTSDELVFWARTLHGVPRPGAHGHRGRAAVAKADERRTGALPPGADRKVRGRPRARPGVRVRGGGPAQPTQRLLLLRAHPKGG
jgi:hypothetical protein